MWAIRYIKSARNGRDGSWRAMASRSSREIGGNVPAAVGIPQGKVLLEACSSCGTAADRRADLGAAGLTCSRARWAREVAPAGRSTSCMFPAGKGRSHTRSCCRSPGAHDSRGQERARTEVERIFEKGLASGNGYVTEHSLIGKEHGTVVAEITNTAMVDDAPVYDRIREESYIEEYTV